MSLFADAAGLTREALLQWYIELGADEAVGEEAPDRFAPPAPVQVAAPVQTISGPHRQPHREREQEQRPEPGRKAALHADAPALSTLAGGRDGAAHQAHAISGGGTGGNTLAAHGLAAAARSLDALRDAVMQLEDFPLKVTATSLVFGEGVEKPDVMFVGEAPGADEDRQGRPFVGVSGQLLDRMMNSIGLDRQRNAYVANILPWRPPGNRPPTAAEIAVCLPFIRRHIALVGPRVLVPVGGTAMQALLDQGQGIMKLHGRRFEYMPESPESGNSAKTGTGMGAPIPAVPLFHPAFLLRSAGQKALAWRDLLLIKQIVM